MLGPFEEFGTEGTCVFEGCFQEPCWEGEMLERCVKLAIALIPSGLLCTCCGCSADECEGAGRFFWEGVFRTA